MPKTRETRKIAAPPPLTVKDMPTLPLRRQDLQGTTGPIIGVYEEMAHFRRLADFLATEQAEKAALRAARRPGVRTKGPEKEEKRQPQNLVPVAAK